MAVDIIRGDCMERLKELADGSVHCCITSPPYFGLRSYDTAKWEGGRKDCDHIVDRLQYAASAKQLSNHGSGSKQAMSVCPQCGARRVDFQIGREKSVEQYIARLVEVFREVRRVLHPTGLLWLNLGDSYNDKELMGTPFKVAFALQDDGWHLRSALPWLKRSAMPESVSDRPSSAVEYVFMFAKSKKYYFDMEAVKVPHKGSSIDRWREGGKDTDSTKYWKEKPDTSVGNLRNGSTPLRDGGRSMRNSDFFFDSWQGMYEENGNPLALVVNTHSCHEMHFATFPQKLVSPMVLSGTSERGCCPTCLSPWQRKVEHENAVLELSPRAKAQRELGYTTCSSGKLVSPARSRTIGWEQSCRCKKHEPIRCRVLDPFGGIGTTGVVAESLGRDSIMIELGEKYVEIMRKQTSQGTLL